MAIETITIRFRADGSRVVKKEIREVGETAKRSSKFVRSLRNVLLTFGAAQVTRAVIGVGAEFQRLDRRIQSVSGSAEEAAENLKLIKDLSQETGSALSTNAAAFSRLSLATESLGLNGAETAGILRTLNQAFVIGGSSAEEASSALLQLGQALASGTLQGDELRSLLENAPLLAKEVANQLGVTIGQLRKMGSEGRLTSRTLIGALGGAAEGIQESFDKLPGTLDQSITRLSNAFTELGSELEPFIGRLAETIEDAATVLRGFQGARDARGAQQRLQEDRNDPTRRAREQLADFETGPVALAVRRISEITNRDVQELRRIISETNLTGGDVQRLLGDVNSALAIGLNAGDVLDRQIDIAQKATDLIRSGLVDTKDLVDETISRIENAQPVEIVGFGGPFGGGSTEVRPFQDQVSALRENEEARANLGFQGVRERLAQDAEAFAEIQAKAAETRARLEATADAIETKVQDVAGAITSRFTAAVQGFADTSVEAFNRLQTGTATSEIIASLKEEQEAIRASTVERETAALVKEAEAELNEKLTGTQLRLNESQVSSIRALVRENEVQRERVAILESLGPSMEQQQIRTEALTLVATELGLTVEELNKKLLEGPEKQTEVFTFLDGVKERFKAIDTSAKGLGIAISDAVVGSVDQAAGALADFAASGFRDVESLREGFANLFEDLGKQILQLIIKTLILRSIQQALGVAPAPVGTPTPGIPGADLSFPQNATGGPIFPNQPTLVGERGPEILTTPTSGMIIPNDRIGAATAEPKTENNVFIVKDPNEIADALKNNPEVQAIIADLVRKQGR